MCSRQARHLNFGALHTQSCASQFTARRGGCFGRVEELFLVYVYFDIGTMPTVSRYSYHLRISG